MDNRRIIDLTLTFKDKLRNEIDNNVSHPDNLKTSIWKTLIMAEIANRSFVFNINIESFEKPYFDRQAAVGRYFCDWGLDWIAEYYYEISNYIVKYYWPDNDKDERIFKKDYVPFKMFNLDNK